MRGEAATQGLNALGGAAAPGQAANAAPAPVPAAADETKCFMTASPHAGEPLQMIPGAWGSTSGWGDASRPNGATGGMALAKAV